MSEKKCPYPGLRPFTEDEAIFFKGRDAHIRQIIRQLEENKIVIVTGASGDGKSSLVYAGIIPNARAGFFQAKHTNWLIADFRPERTPLINLAHTLAECFAMEQDEVYDELSLGFSALVDLYKSTPFSVDKNSQEWQNASDSIRKALKVKAANLLILADQFEEFFTNTENFSQGKPSAEAYTAVNILLETAQIALDEDLPIYVVFTMRSDFISQCVAFKGLPEAIGFSQFFIPRLKRHEMQQVIEEPAMLSGGNVTKRLTEVLINDLREGFDRLPVLQHALNQLWKQAENGDEEIDLIHLAKLAGLPPHILPEKDRKVFEKWYMHLPAHEKHYFEQPSLSNVLNTHANLLYESAYDHYTSNEEWVNKTLPKAKSKDIQKVAFQSLTKIDDGRSVRNRMSLKEITQIINDPDVSYETVCAILNVFRLQDSTFIRPFINSNDVDTQYLAADTVLDITHEALIRNWEKLRDWEDEEQANYTDFLDFKIQLDRWISHGKEATYLLSVGSLAHFEEWYLRCQPSKYWIAKYDDSALDKETKIAEASVIADNAIEFIEVSKERIRLEERKKKLRRTLASVISIIIIFILSGFLYWASKEKAYAQEQEQVAKRQTELAEIEKNRALKANKQAELEKIKAQASAQTAKLAQKQSEKAFQEANAQRQIAQRQSEIAKQQAQQAMEAQRKANEQHRIADEQRQRAELASDKANTLTYLFVAQALAYKSANDYDDPQLNLLLSELAYRFHSRNGGRENSPAISTGLRTSLYYSGYSNSFVPQLTNPIAFAVNEDRISVTDQQNRIAEFSRDFKPKAEWEIEQKTIINRSFVFGDFSVLSYESGENYLVKGNSEPIRLNEQSGLLRAARYSEDGFLLTAYRNGNVFLYDTKELKSVAQTTLLGYNRPSGISFSKKKDEVFIATKRGYVLKWNTNNVTPDTLFKANSLILNLNYVRSEDLLLVGLSKGQIVMIDPNNGKKKLTIRNSIAAVDYLVVHPSEKYFAAASSAGEIKIYDFQNLNETPLVITEHNSKIKQLFYSDDRLWALSQQNVLFFWENDARQYQNEVQKRLKRNFTQEEWDAYVGETVPYEKLISR